MFVAYSNPAYSRRCFDVYYKSNNKITYTWGGYYKQLTSTHLTTLNKTVNYIQNYKWQIILFSFDQDFYIYIFHVRHGLDWSQN